MAKEQDMLSTEIVKRGIEDSGPYAGSLSFSVRVRRGLPDFLNTVNLKYVKLGYAYLLSHGMYFLTAPLVIFIFSIVLRELTLEDFCPKCDPMNAFFLCGMLGLILYIYLVSTPRSTYLVDFACFRPPNDLKISREEFIELARKSGNFDDAAIEFQQRALKNSGIGDESYIPRVVFQPGRRITLEDGREEAAMVIFGAVDDLLATTKIQTKDIRILVVNCGILNPTPSLSAMVINHYKLRHNINSFNLGGMGCAAGVIAIDLAKDLLKAYPGSYALVVSTEVVSYTWYAGNDPDMLLANSFFRMGAAAMLLSSFRLDRWRSKYELKQLVRTHKGMDSRSFKSIHLKEDKQGKQGLSVSKDVIEVAGHALKANITTKNLELTDEYMEASRKTLERFGNTSSSSVWYELAYLEANARIKKGDRIWQLAFGSGFKCNSVVWKALRSVGKPERNPWMQESV
ncbi:hypothetical protein GH714_001655 [Hevea brasiliensis]|uniref:3-ketoacyl-CoA synthase n=2 Tax=Hevea brasiliensis TaxID=3981 RepID=A0A6A6KPQ8_HEVBR|nr:hypothetical protein GH714_001655 [Hevea brasiliensis]